VNQKEENHQKTEKPQIWHYGLVTGIGLNLSETVAKKLPTSRRSSEHRDNLPWIWVLAVDAC
jgi:hypothetical protein